jgi:hypothetical protein
LPARLGTQIHPLELDGAVAEVAQRSGADHTAVLLGYPKHGVARGGIVEIDVERRVQLEAKLRQRVRYERAKAVGMPRLERND